LRSAATPTPRRAPVKYSSTGALFIGSKSRGSFSALDVETGDVRWRQTGISSTDFSPVALESGIVVPDGFGIQAIGLETGEQLAATGDLIDVYGATGSGRTVVSYGDRALAFRL